MVGKCNVCGDLCNDTQIHRCNERLAAYNYHKKQFTANKEGAYVSCNADFIGQDRSKRIRDLVEKKIRVFVTPNTIVNFEFFMKNEATKFDMLLLGVDLAHPQDYFVIEENRFEYKNGPTLLPKKSSISQEHSVRVKFVGADVGQYEMPIVFTFSRPADGDPKAQGSNDKNSTKIVIIVREMVVSVNATKQEHQKAINPFKEDDKWCKADMFLKSTADRRNEMFRVPELLKILIPNYVMSQTAEKAGFDQYSEETRKQLWDKIVSTNQIIQEGVTKENYAQFFHHLLWWEEIVARKCLRKYNMPEATLQKMGDAYILEVPGLAERRPSLLPGDRVFLRPILDKEEESKNNIIFEGCIEKTDDNLIHIGDIDDRFTEFYNEEMSYKVRFIMSRHVFERTHAAVDQLAASGHRNKVFPELQAGKSVQVKRITRFFNPLIARNEEQRSAVEHMVSGSSGSAPYMVFGPPGTGKTRTIVEAILQIVVSNSNNRVMVCTDSNMAADHVAMQVLKYKRAIKIDGFLIRVNAKTRIWECMPAELEQVSNGSCAKSFYPMSNKDLGDYRIVVTTLLHAAKYAQANTQSRHKLSMTHLFIDEAAQALEPACLVPAAGLLRAAGRLVLAGDHKQLGPVLVSQAAKEHGLGKSLMERLQNEYSNIYTLEGPHKYKYITMLVKNFRSHPDILEIPNEVFYQNRLEPQVKDGDDPLSTQPIFGNDARALVFHSVNSKEQRLGKSPSYYNEKELEIVQRYIIQLVTVHKVEQKDIGVITPYMRQVQKMNFWLEQKDYKAIEVGTVESFQGKEKRVILISTVRANCKLLDYDAKYQLGFLIDPKRFNVAITRAKAKLIVVGNHSCLVRNPLWAMFMNKCKEINSYVGKEYEQMLRDTQLLTHVAFERFKKFRLDEALEDLKKKPKNKKKGQK